MHSDRTTYSVENTGLRAGQLQDSDGESDIEDLGLFVDDRPYAPPAPLSRRTRLYILLGVSSLAAIIALGIFLTQAFRLPHSQIVLPVLAGTPVPAGAAQISTGGISHLEEFARWGRGSATQVTFSPDGKMLAIASSIGVYLYDYLEAGRRVSLSRFIDTPAWAWSVAFSPDSKVLAAGLGDGRIEIWQTDGAGNPHVIAAHSGQVNSIAFSPDGRRLVSGSADGAVELWQLDRGEPARTLRPKSVADGRINSVAYSTDGATVASTGESGVIQIWQVSDGALVGTLNGRSGTIGSMQFSRDGALLAAAPYGSGVHLWSTQISHFLGELDPKRTGSGSVALSPDGQLVATSSGFDDTISVWRGISDTPIRTLIVNANSYSGSKSLAFSPDNHTLAAVAADGSIRLWSVPDWSLLFSLDGDNYSGERIAYSPDGQIIAVANDDGRVQLWDANSGVLLRSINASDHQPEYLAFSPDSLLITEILYTPQGSAAWTWRVSDGLLTHSYDITEESLVLMAISPDSQVFATQARGGTVRLWRFHEGKRLNTIDLSKGTGGSTGRMALSPGGRVLACALLDGKIELWNTADGTLIRTVTGAPDVENLSISPDGQTLVALRGTEVSAWHLSDGLPIQLANQTQTTQSGRETGIVFSPDSKMLASFNALAIQPTVTFWLTNNLGDRHTLASGNFSIKGLAFAPDGQTLATVTADRTVRLWRIRGDADGKPFPTPQP